MARQVQELIQLLPYDVRDRFRYYLDYVHDTLADIAMEEGVYYRLKEIREEAELIFLLRLLYGYFVVGFQNYEQMLSYFESKQVRGFQIGRTAFTRTSPLTAQWQQVANDLERLVSTAELVPYVRPGTSVAEVLRRLIRSLPDISEEE
jgi:hypothetical protein